jgi:hypothetical protein
MEEDRRLAAEIEASLFRADETDRREDAQASRHTRGKSATAGRRASPRPDDDDDGGGGNAASELPSHRVPATPQGEPSDKAQAIVAHAVTNQPPDQEHLVPMLERLREHRGRLPEIVSADSGYGSERNATY